LEVRLGPAPVTKYQDRGEEYGGAARASDPRRGPPADLTNLYVRPQRTGELIALSNLVHVREQADAGTLRRFNRLPAATIEAGLAPGVSLGEGLGALESLARSLLPDTAHFDYDGDSLEFVESS